MKKVLCALLAAVVAASVLCLSAAAAPKPLYEETFDNMTQGVDGETFFLDSDIISNGRHIDQNTYIDGKVAISSDKDKVVDGTKSLYFHNYVSEEDEGPYYAQWGNFFSTKPVLKDSTTYVMSFLLRTHTAWDPTGNTITPTHTQNFGIVRIIASDPERAAKILTDDGHAANIREVVAFAVPDIPGGLAKALNILETNGEDIEYMYALVTKETGKAYTVMRTGDTKRTEELLLKNGIEILDEAHI